MKKWISPIPKKVHFIWLGSDPSSTTNNAQFNTSVGINSLDKGSDVRSFNLLSFQYVYAFGYKPIICL